MNKCRRVHALQIDGAKHILPPKVQALQIFLFTDGHNLFSKPQFNNNTKKHGLFPPLLYWKSTKHGQFVDRV